MAKCNLSDFNYYLGGKDSKIVMEYDEKNDEWTKINEMHFPRAGYLLKLPKKMNNLEFNW